ncbi:MAG: plasmid mobilization protein [Ruminococcus bicirculans (ex Wegman et al. 2014)]
MNPERKEMRKIAEIEPHNRYMQIRLTEAEYEAIERKFRNSGLRSRSEFIRTMIFEGYIVNFDEEKFDKIYRLVRSISNNVNQIAVRVNSTDKVYVEDMNNIKDGVEKIWQQLRYFQSQLRSVKQ